MSRTTTKQESVIAAAMTTPAQIERLGEHLRKLRRLKSGERLEAIFALCIARSVRSKVSADGSPSADRTKPAQETDMALPRVYSSALMLSRSTPETILMRNA